MCKLWALLYGQDILGPPGVPVGTWSLYGQDILGPPGVPVGTRSLYGQDILAPPGVPVGTPKPAEWRGNSSFRTVHTALATGFPAHL